MTVKSNTFTHAAADYGLVTTHDNHGNQFSGDTITCANGEIVKVPELSIDGLKFDGEIVAHDLGVGRSPMQSRCEKAGHER